MATVDVTQKSQIYHTLSELNTAFAPIVGHCETLQQTGLFKSKASKLLPSFVQELQAECNQEFLETIEAIELEDWNRFGKVRQKWEKYIGDPDDVFIHAEERRKELARHRKKKKGR
jgi:hypothetical protein